MRIEDDGFLDVETTRADGTDVAGRVPAFEAVNAHADAFRRHGDDGNAFWAACQDWLAGFGLSGLTQRAADNVFRACAARMEDLRKNDRCSPSAS